MATSLLTDWQITGEPPKAYGPYHLVCLALTVVLCILLCKTLASKHDKKTDDIVIFAFGCVLVGIEIYKQIFVCRLNSNYPWGHFPFQFCSVPMYVAFIAPHIKHEKTKEAFYQFLAFYGLTAGVAVMLNPASCLNNTYIAMLAHTMIWHISIILMGVYLLCAKGYGQSFLRELPKACLVFVGVVMMATISNEIAFQLFTKYPHFNPDGHEFNLFYLSPYYDIPVSFLVSFKEKCPLPLFVLLYIAVFTLGATLVWVITHLSRKAQHKTRNT